MIIVGAGLAGLIAANVLSHTKPTVLEAQTKLPNNHQALLRFKSNKVSEAVKIPFTRMVVHKSVVMNNVYLDKPNPYVCNMYSYKVTGKIMDRSIWNLDEGERWIAPDDFISKLSYNASIKLGYSFSKPHIKEFIKDGRPIISTIPMPILMRIMEWHHIPEFDYMPIWSFNGLIELPEVNTCQTIYYPDLDKPYYRASIVGRRFIIEFSKQIDNPLEYVNEILDDFGVEEFELLGGDKTTINNFGKILPIPEEIRQDFIYSMSREHNIYSLGRFATWRSILLDDLIHDIEIIDKLANSENRRKLYHQQLNLAKH